MNIFTRAYWWLQYRFGYKFHQVDLKIKPGYCDVDYRMLHACFSLLEDYVELEKPIAWFWGGIDPRTVTPSVDEFGYDNTESIASNSLMLDLYDWWQGYKKILHHDNTDYLGYEIEDELHEAAQYRLEQLIEIRNTLWT